MAIINRIAEFHEDMKTWRRHLHQNPELGFEVHETAAFVVEKLREFGVDEIFEGVGRTGVVGIIKGQGDGPTIGLRADMDALPILEVRDLPYKSKNPGKMHACGHDGHTTMLLGAARYLAETRNFAGSVALIFQPAEEGGFGGLEMVKDGMIERFDISQVYGIHNWPGIPVGGIASRSGPVMAAADKFDIHIKGRGSHAAQPDKSVDPIMVMVQMIQSLQTITSRNVDPIESAVLSVTRIDAGTAYNIIPDTASFFGTVRTLSPAVRDQVESRMNEIVAGVAATFGASATLDFQRGYPVTVNDVEKTAFAGEVAASVVGAENVTLDRAPEMGSEDFSYMLEKRPGAYLYVGNGDTAGLHHPEYDFDDNASPVGASLFAKLVEMAQPVLR